MMATALSEYLQLPHLIEHIQQFLYNQQNPDSDVFGMDVDLDICPKPEVPPMLHIKIFHSAMALYHALSDLCGIGRMHIRSTPSWK
jgi:hypothetical protein